MPDLIPNPLDQIPTPEVVRKKLSANLREARLLRRLLAVAETAISLRRPDTADRETNDEELVSS